MELSDGFINYVLIPAAKAFIFINIMAVMAGVLTLFERRILAFMQVRKGPNRVGFEGSLQWIADTIKLMFKEDIVPTKAEKLVHFLAPVLVVVPALTVFCVIPWGPEFTVRLPLLGRITTGGYATDLNVGLLFVLAVTSIGIYGIILGGWASNSKYALLGGLRSAAQLISYEVPMGFAVVSVILMSSSLSLVEIIEAQRRFGMWFIFPGLLAFFLYFLSGVAETNRIPFDLPEAESELVAGFHTEYSGVKWSFFFLGEYANMVTISAIATTLFLGGWLRPFPSVQALSFLDIVPGAAWFLLKISVFMFVYIWFRATFPRYRFDQLMALGWKTLIPLSMGNLVLVAIAALGGRRGLNTLGTILWTLFGVSMILTLRARSSRRSLAARTPIVNAVPGVLEVSR
ncbi:MAG: NADH-quinone oxidoreductase subunit NuoH [Thermoanaerobaculia bacterium]